MTLALDETDVVEHTGRPGQRNPVLLHRLRMSAICLLLTVVAFLQDPGARAADTKLDLLVDPVGFLSRSLHLWEPLGFFGQLQNQAYGYLWPMGPFFALGDLSGLPMWIVQRLWWAGLLCAAFLGVARLARLLGVSWAPAAIVAGLAYALAPRMVTELGVLSVEVLPYAVAPWVLVPLVSVALRRTGSLRRSAALSGIAIACAGGVNAVASASVLPLALWWILVRFRGRSRVVLLGWWALAATLAIGWWLIPLVLLGKYSPPFLDWIESSSVTTLITSPDTVLRGTDQWVAYVADGGGPVWPGGWQLVTTPVLIVATGLVAAVGLTGIALRSTPWRLFLLGGVVAGWILVSMGHVGVVSGFGAETMRALLDAGLAPLRNTHKFDVLIRLPLALGVGFALQAAAHRVTTSRWVSRQQDVRLWASRVLVGCMTALIVLAAWPAITGDLTRGRSYVDVPGYWGEAARWLADAEVHGTALLVPGASFGIYSWGRTQDEPLQPLATTPWAVRDAVPLSSAGNIRWLDSVQERLDSGRGSPGLADALARAGVRYVVVRNDIDRRRSDTPRSILIRQALVRSGGFTPAAGFGPVLPPYRSETTVVDDGLQDTSAAVEIWQVDSPYAAPDARVTLRDASSVLLTSGSAEALPDLADADVLQGRAVITDGDSTQELVDAGATVVDGVTDTYLRTEVNVGRARNNRSQALTADDAWLIARRVHDYLPVDPVGRQATAVFTGGTPSASSSGSDASSLRGRSAATQPWAAVDGDPATYWVSGDLAPGVGQWWEVTTDQPFTADSIDVRLLVGDVAGEPPTTITVTTDAGSLDVPVTATDQPQSLPLPPGSTSRVRLTLAAVADGSEGEGFGLREVDLPFDVSRRIVTAGAADGGPIVLTARRGEQAGCVTVAGQLACSATLAQVGEERAGLHRTVTIATPGDYRVRISVRPRSGTNLSDLLAPLSVDSPVAAASSLLSTDPAIRAQSAIDGSFETAWVASPLESRPQLSIRWETPAKVRGVRLLIRPELAASRPLTVTVDAGGAPTKAVVDSSGTIRIPPVTTDHLTLTFDNTSAVRSLDPLTGAYAALPIGVNEVRILGADSLIRGPRPVDDVTVPCGYGPALSIDGTLRTNTEVSGTVGDALTDTLMTARPCSGQVLSLTAGTHQIDIPSTAEFVVESAVLEPIADVGVLPSPQSPEVVQWDATSREVVIESSDHVRLLELSENANPGWVAHLADQQLASVRVDGWRQAWVVPAGMSGVVTMAFAPDRLYLAGLIGGSLGMLVLIALAVWRPRRLRPVQVAEPTTGPVAAWSLVMLAVVAAALVAGVPGVVVAVVTAAACALIARPWLTLALAGAAAIVAACIPWPTTLSQPAWIQGTAALLAVAAVVAAASQPAKRDRFAGSTSDPFAGRIARWGRPRGG